MVIPSDSRNALAPELKARLQAFLKTQSFSLGEAGDATDDSAAQRRLEQVQSDVQVLADRASALEAQSILVAVQSLDFIAQSIAWMSSLSAYAFYSALVWWILPGGESYLASKLAVQLPGSPTPVSAILAILVSWIFRLTILALPFLYNRETHGSLHRRMEVFAVAFLMIARIRLCRWREKDFGSEDNDTDDDADKKVTRLGESLSSEALWEMHYEVSARFLYCSIRRLRGLWTKTAQYLSSRADFMPRGYVRELSRLQDEAPATPWAQIVAMLPPAIRQQLTEIDETPLASASIGQVHTAQSKKTGEKVVIKVQHPHARTLLLDDFVSLAIILRIVAWMEPDYEFLEILMREWAKEARQELDFGKEAQNLIEAKESVQQLWPQTNSVVYATDEEGQSVPFQVQVPQPVESLSNREVLVMEFCEGVRIDNFARLQEWGLSRRAVLDAVTQTFGHLMYGTTIFNGDPHPGNLMIRPGMAHSKKGFTVVLLDWGLVKRLPERKRLAFCQLVYAASTFDYGLLMDSYKTIGLRMKKEDVSRSMANVRFMLRDMATRDKARKRIKNKLKNDSEESKLRAKDDRVPMQSKAYPGEFFFFVRVNELLHGLGSRFDVDMGFLDTMRPYAEKGLRESSMYSEATVAPQIVVPMTSIDHSLEVKLKNTMQELEASKAIIGAQLCIIDKNGDTLADVFAGTLGGLKSHIPMQSSALVLGYSCTKAIATTVAHIMVAEGYLSYDEPVCARVWSNFCPSENAPTDLTEALSIGKEELQQRWEWKREISLWHILTHQAGMSASLPTNLTIKDLASCEYCSTSFEYDCDVPEHTLLPDRGPGEEVEYHALSFGWLVAGALCGAFTLRHGKKTATFQEVYDTVLAPKLSDETLTLGFRPCGGKGNFVLAQTAISEMGLSSVLQRRREMSSMGEGEAEEASGISETLKQFRGKEFLLDPRIWNSMDAIDANVPAAGGRFSAKGLAHFYHDLGSGRLLEKSIIDNVSSLVVMEKKGSSVQGVTSLSDDDRTALGCGYQLLRFDKDGDQPSGFGHAGVGGSIGVHHRPTGLSMALMMNKADGGKETTLKIMKVVGEHFNI